MGSSRVVQGALDLGYVIRRWEEHWDEWDWNYVLEINGISANEKPYWEQFQWLNHAIFEAEDKLTWEDDGLFGDQNLIGVG